MSEAARAKNTGMVAAPLAHGAHAGHPNTSDAETALQSAVLYKLSEMVQLLIGRDDVNPNTDNHTPLMMRRQGVSLPSVLPSQVEDILTIYRNIRQV